MKWLPAKYQGETFTFFIEKIMVGHIFIFIIIHSFLGPLQKACRSIVLHPKMIPSLLNRLYVMRVKSRSTCDPSALNCRIYFKKLMIVIRLKIRNRFNLRKQFTSAYNFLSYVKKMCSFFWSFYLVLYLGSSQTYVCLLAAVQILYRIQ